MSIEYCAQIRKVIPDKLPRREVEFCAKAGTDMGCHGYSDSCPPKMQKYFISERGIPLERVTFEKFKPEEINESP